MCNEKTKKKKFFIIADFVLKLLKNDDKLIEFANHLLVNDHLGNILNYKEKKLIPAFYDESTLMFLKNF